MRDKFHETTHLFRYCNRGNTNESSSKIIVISYSARILAFTLLFILTSCTVVARKLDDIYWNSSNPMFDISNTHHVKTVKLLDRVTIVCPHVTDSIRRYEFTKLYLVSREAYERCELPRHVAEGNKEARLLGVCAAPERQSSISIVFREFSALSSVPRFRAGHSYYVITTSDGTENGLNKTFGGLCLTRNMKMKFDVAKEDSLSSEEEDEDLPLNLSQPVSNPSKEFSTSNAYEMIYEIHTIDSLESTSPPAASILSIFDGDASHRRRASAEHKDAFERDAQKLKSSNGTKVSFTTLWPTFTCLIIIFISHLLARRAFPLPVIQ